tara:strand:- start:1263 stop:1586 length:324 start_codon:yes stop_codon:yes gene_type:complete
MIIYNVTCNVESSVSQDWQKWMKEVHIPEIMQCGFFISSNMHRVLSRDDNGETFAIQYKCQSLKDLHYYEIKFSKDLQKKHNDRFGDKVVVFRTILEELDTFHIKKI